MKHYPIGLPEPPFLKRSFRLLGLGFLMFPSFLPSLRAENAVEDFKLSGSEEAGTSFGQAVSVSGKVALVGAPTDTGATLPEAGAAHLFLKNGPNWEFSAKLTDPDGGESDFFGLSVAVSGDVAIVGAPGDDDFGEPGDDVLLDAGSAFIFRYNGTSWDFEQKLTSSDAAGLDLFGFSVAISGNVAIVGADEQQEGPGGSAYVFRYDGTTWNEESILKGRAGANDNFGISVAVSGKVAIVGASPAFGDSQSGSAYLFSDTNRGNWIEVQELSAPLPVAGDLFGESVSISGTRAIVSARGTAAAYLFHNPDNTTWEEETMLTANDPSPGANYGFSVTISGDVALVTAPTKEREDNPMAGKAFLYRSTGDGWSESEILPSDPPVETSGWSVALSSEYALVGTVGGKGAAYLYHLAPAITWNTPAAIVAGTALGTLQLNASAGAVPGVFNYSPLPGQEIPPGRNTLTASFTPADAARYASTLARVEISVFTPISSVDDLFVLPLQEDRHEEVPDRRFHPLHNDQFTDHSSTAGYTLRLRRVDDVAQLSKEEESMIIIALVADRVVWIRIFDGSGTMAFNLPESGLISGQILGALREVLLSIKDKDLPTTEEIGFLMGAATYLSGYSPGICFEVNGLWSDTLVTPKGATAFTNGVEIFYRGYETTPDEDSFIYHIRDGGRGDSSLITIRTLVPDDTPGWGDYGPELGAWLALAGNLAGQGGSPLLSAASVLYRTYPDELYAAAVNYPALGEGLPLGDPGGSLPGDGAPRGELLQVFEALQPGLIALLLQDGRGILITAEMAELTRSFLKNLVALSSDAELSLALSTVLEVDETEIIGLSFEEFATAAGLDPGRIKLPVLKQDLAFPSFSLTTFHLPGLDYALSRSPSLSVGIWPTVTHTATINPAGTITLTDATTPGGRMFYRMMMKRSSAANP